MAVPSYEEFEYPILELMSDKMERKNGEIKTLIPSFMNLSDDVLQEKNANGHLKYQDNIGFAISYLYMAGLLERPRYAFYKISQQGLNILQNPDINALNLKMLKEIKPDLLQQDAEESVDEENNYQEINKLLSDVKELEKLNNQWNSFNIFDVLGIVRNEIRHSNVLAWLFNPKESHNLGGSILFNLLILITNQNAKFDKSKYLLLDLNSFEVRREENNIDLLIISETQKVLIAIENKIDSKEHASTGFNTQLNKYREYLENKYSDYDRICFYLTKEGDEPSDSDNWNILTYSDISKIISDVIRDKNLTIKEDVKYFIKDYLEILRRDIIMDEELKSICDKIYSKYPKAFDLIFENCERGNAKYYRGVKKALKELGDSGKILYDSNKATWFLTTAMDNYIPKFDEATGSYNMTRCYIYWLEVNGAGTKLILHFEFGLLNIDNIQAEKQKIIMDYNKVQLKNQKKYIRVYKEDTSINENEEDDLTEVMYKATIKLVDKAIKWEKDMLEKINN